MSAAAGFLLSLATTPLSNEVKTTEAGLHQYLRRFLVNCLLFSGEFYINGNIDIDTLNKRIQEKFPHLGDKEIVIKWEDEEGDKVDITSQQELGLAMQEMSKTCSVYKFHVHILENPWWKQVSVL